jgi:hypothetical protein
MAMSGQGHADLLHVLHAISSLRKVTTCEYFVFSVWQAGSPAAQKKMVILAPETLSSETFACSNERSKRGARVRNMANSAAPLLAQRTVIARTPATIFLALGMRQRVGLEEKRIFSMLLCDLHPSASTQILTDHVVNGHCGFP